MRPGHAQDNGNRHPSCDDAMPALPARILQLTVPSAVTSQGRQERPDPADTGGPSATPMANPQIPIAFTLTGENGPPYLGSS